MGMRVELICPGAAVDFPQHGKTNVCARHVRERTCFKLGSHSAICCNVFNLLVGIRMSSNHRFDSISKSYKYLNIENTAFSIKIVLK